MAEEPTLEELKDRIRHLESLVTTEPYTPEGPEYSFPLTRRGVSSEEFKQISRAIGTGVFVQHSETGAQTPYRLVGMPGGDSETNAENTMILKTSSVTNRSESSIQGFFHRQTEDIPIHIPPVTKTTTYHLCLTLDLRDEQEDLGPIRWHLYDEEPPVENRRTNITLYTIKRDPNQLLTDARISRTLPWLGYVINVWSHHDLPDPTTLEYGVLAVVVIPGRETERRPEIYTNRGVHGWVKVSGASDNDWKPILGRNGWETGTSRVRHTPLGLQFAGYIDNNGQTNTDYRIGLIPEGYRPDYTFRGSAQVSTSVNPVRVQIEPNGSIYYRRPSGIGVPSNICLDGLIVPYSADRSD